MSESFRDLRRQKREQQAFRNFLEYARRAELDDPETIAREAARQIHGSEVAARDVAPGRARSGTKQRPTRRAESPTTSGDAEKSPATVATAPPPSSGPAPAAGGDSSAPTESTALRKNAGGGDGATESVPHRLEDRTKEQLYTRAQELEIEGRSQMTKEELIAAIRAQQ